MCIRDRYNTDDQIFRRCRLPPHWKAHEGCRRCKFHCGMPLGNADARPSLNRRKKKKDSPTKKKDKSNKGRKDDEDPDQDRSKWKFDPVTGRALRNPQDAL